MRVLDIMTTDVLTASPDEGIKAAARRMVEAGVSGLPVLDDENALVGIITEADFLGREAERSTHRYGRLLDALFGESEPRAHADTVGEAMTPNPIVVHVDTPVSEAARIMARREVKRLPVIDEDGHLVGIVSRADIVGVFVRPDDVIEDEIEEDLVRRILMIDGDDVAVAVVDGKVTLSGTTPTRSDARLLEELVSRLEGVVDVDSGLSWRVDDTVSTDSPPLLT